MDARLEGLRMRWMKEEERSPLAHTLKGDGKEEIVEDMWVWNFGYKNPKWRKEIVELEQWIWV